MALSQCVCVWGLGKNNLLPLQTKPDQGFLAKFHFSKLCNFT